MKKIIVLILSVVILSGCTKLKQLMHISRLLQLKKLSENGELKAAYVEEHDAKFEELLEVVKSNQIDQYTQKEEFLRDFGEPVFSKTTADEGQVVEQWMYRYSMQLTGSEKVYLFFDQTGRLMDWEHVEPKEQKG